MTNLFMNLKSVFDTFQLKDIQQTLEDEEIPRKFTTLFS